ncbi:MAG: lactate racemase domain-containing protein [Thermoanaerobaculales bacterium]
MIVNIPFGSGRVPLDLRGLRVRALRPAAPAGSSNPGGLVGEALANPLDGSPLAERARGRRTATVVVPDATRKAALPSVLPEIIRNLRRGGIEEERITILVACGTHPGVGGDAVGRLLGPLPSGVQVLEHDSRAAENLVVAGELRPGILLRLHRAALDCDLLVTVGSVRHHYFAGFGGGPKMIFPGVGGYDEIQANHALVLRVIDGEPERHPGCEPGILDGNPVASEITRAADLRPPDCALCLVEGCDGGIAWAGAGTWRVAFGAAVERVRSWYEIHSPPPFDLMIAGGGGAPTDTTLIQAHKALDAASRFLAPGGELLFLASLDGGAGSPEMTPFLEDPSTHAILARLARGWVQYGHTTLRIVEKTRKYHVRLHSRLDPSLGSALGFDPTPNPEAVLESWRRRQPGASVGVMAQGPVFPSPP